jgi:hypothetical protein
MLHFRENFSNFPLGCRARATAGSAGKFGYGFETQLKFVKGERMNSAHFGTSLSGWPHERSRSSLWFASESTPARKKFTIGMVKTLSRAYAIWAARRSAEMSGEFPAMRFSSEQLVLLRPEYPADLADNLPG